MVVSPEIVNSLREQGYSDEQISRVDQESRGYGEQTAFQYNSTDNLIKWQLELNDILERAEHILKQDVVAVEMGNILWKPNPNQEKRIFNEYGVQEIMRILSMYINRNTILSDYEPDEINDIVFDIGKEINDLIFMKYEDFGLTTLEKRKNYPILHREMIDVIHSSYKRAQYGAERDSLRTARSLQQIENVAPPNINIATGELRKERGFLNPLRWVGGKYK